MPQVTIHVPPRPYPARIENGLLARAGDFVHSECELAVIRHDIAVAKALGFAELA